MQVFNYKQAPGPAVLLCDIDEIKTLSVKKKLDIRICESCVPAFHLPTLNISASYFFID